MVTVQMQIDIHLEGESINSLHFWKIKIKEKIMVFTFVRSWGRGGNTVVMLQSNDFLNVAF